MNKKIVILFLIFGISQFFIFSQSLKKTQQELNKTKKILKEKKAQRELYITHQRNIREELNRIDRDIKSINDEIKAIKDKIYKTELEIKSLEQNLEYLSLDANFYKHLVSVYINRYVNKYFLITPLFEDNFYRRIKKDILRSYAKELLYTKSQINYVVKLKQEYSEKKERLKEYHKNLLNKQAQQKKLLIQKGDLLEEYKLKQRKVEQEISELRKTQSELENLLKKLQIEEQRRKQQQKRPSQQQYVQQKPKIEISTKFMSPLNGEIIEKFGKKQVCADGSCIVNNGIIIQGISNSDVIASENGRVLFVSNSFRSYGKIVIIEHKNDIHTIYGRLGEILVSEGNYIKKGQIIGKTDSSGQIYFELRSNFVAVNPELYFE